MIANSSLGHTPPARQRLEFAYDGQSRRVRKVVKAFNLQTSSFSLVSDLRFVYDAWNLIAEFSMKLETSNLELLRSYAWGYDLSATEQGAGGVGGLVLVKQSLTTVNNSNPPSTSLAPCYDGNGNILAYLDCITGTITQRMEYDAFGVEMSLDSVLTQPSTSNSQLPFRFSTKYMDSETSLSYYGYRYYAPELGRWLSRDPIAERGGINLYGMVGNDPVNRIDLLGLAASEPCSIELHVGHWSTVKDIWKNRKKEGWKPPCGYAFGTMSCFSQETMGQLENEIGEDNLLKNTGLTEPGLDFLEKEAEKLADFVKAAHERAAKICESKCCEGKQVTIKVRCDADLVDRANAKNALGEYLRPDMQRPVSAFCNKDIKHDCPKK